MLYCKKCGKAVNEEDSFCEFCMSNLRAPNAVLTVQEESHEKHDGEFSPNAAAMQNELIGARVFGYRITKEHVRDYDNRYFSAIKDNEEKLIQYISYPSLEQYNQVYAEYVFNKTRTDQFFNNIIKEYESKLLRYKEKMEKAGLPSVLEKFSIGFSEKTGTYHIFFLLKNATRLKDLVFKRDFTTRECIQLVLSLGHDLADLHKLGLSHNELTDSNIFLVEEGKRPVLGFPNSWELHRISGLNSNATLLRDHYAEPESSGGMSDDIYGTSLMLYKLLNNYRNPFINIHADYNMQDVFEAERNRMSGMVPMEPHFAGNAVGKAVVKGLMPKKQRFQTMDEFTRILENSLNYLTAEELDSVALDHKKITASIQGGYHRPSQKKEFRELRDFQTEYRQTEQQPTLKVTRNLEQNDKAKDTRKGLKVAVIAVCVLLVLLLALFLNERSRNNRSSVKDTICYIRPIPLEDIDAGNVDREGVHIHNRTAGEG